ncbi:EAL domain-containing protein [Vibrio sp. NTOU-M3]|uniref:EAL domain-containing protein n=1 Tax=Vibrio sp. NTOU-M3 TaxID=3234954 RepID=UPI00349FC7EF
MDIDYDYHVFRERVEQTIFFCEQDGVCASYKDLKFASVFQPIFDRNMNVHGVEALVRIKDQHEQYYRPDLYFRSIEQDDHETLFVTLMCAVLHVLNFARSGYRDSRIFINVAPSIFELVANDQAAIDHLVSNLGRHQLTSDQITYEIMELQGRDDAQMVSGISKLAEHGIRIALDDYGVQCSTAERAKTIQPDYLKLDRSIIMTDPEKVVSNISCAIKLAGQINARTIAEGIETKEVLDACMDNGVDYFQGYWLARPEKAPPIAQ